MVAGLALAVEKRWRGCTGLVSGTRHLHAIRGRSSFDPPIRRHPGRRFPVVNVALIVANFAVFLFYELPNLDAAINQASFYPCDVTNACHLGIPWGSAGSRPCLCMPVGITSWATCCFWRSSATTWRMLSGGSAIWPFTSAGGFAATVLQTAVTLLFGTAADAQSANLGASGAIAAVLGAYIVLYPRSRILALVGWIPVRLPAWFFLGLWFLLQLFAGNFALVHPDKTGGSGVAFFAHVGGFVFGVVVAIILTRAGRITAGFDNRAQVRPPTRVRSLAAYRDSTASALAARRMSTTAAAPEGHMPQKSTNVRCFLCGHVQAVPLSEATFECTACGAKLARKTPSATGSS